MWKEGHTGGVSSVCADPFWAGSVRGGSSRTTSLGVGLHFWASSAARLGAGSAGSRGGSTFGGSIFTGPFRAASFWGGSRWAGFLFVFLNLSSEELSFLYFFFPQHFAFYSPPYSCSLCCHPLHLLTIFGFAFLPSSLALQAPCPSQDPTRIGLQLPASFCVSWFGRVFLNCLLYAHTSLVSVADLSSGSHLDLETLAQGLFSLETSFFSTSADFSFFFPATAPFVFDWFVFFIGNTVIRQVNLSFFWFFLVSLWRHVLLY